MGDTLKLCALSEYEEMEPDGLTSKSHPWNDLKTDGPRTLFIVWVCGDGACEPIKKPAVKQSEDRWSLDISATSQYLNICRKQEKAPKLTWKEEGSEH